MAVTSILELGLNSGRAMPQLGFGVFCVPPERTEAAVAASGIARERAIAALNRDERVGPDLSRFNG